MKTLKNFPIYKKCAKQTENQNANIQKKNKHRENYKICKNFSDV